MKYTSAALACALALLCPLVGAQGVSGGSTAAPAPQGDSGSAPERATSASASPESPPPEGAKVLIEAPYLFNRKTRYAHSMPEVPGPEITVTKKTTVVQLADQPPIIDNHQRELFDRMPGVVLAEQQNPTQLNLSYRGLGNPQESEFILLMQDGIPMEMDWIGFPTLYYIPVPESIEQVQMIRGGSGLLYGPEPEPVINFVSKGPTPRTQAMTQQVGGSDGLYSTFNSVSGTSGPVGFLADFSHRQSNGQRANGDYALNAGDLDLDYHIDSQQKVSLALHAYSLDSGIAGLMNYAQFQANSNQTTTPDDRDWASRYTAVLTYANQLDNDNLFEQKVWAGYQDLITRAGAYAGAPPVATGTTVQAQRFHYTGLDGRFVHHYGRGAAFTVGYTAYYSTSPYHEFSSTDPLTQPYDPSGFLIYNDERRTRYGAVFAENVYRFRRFHIVTSARFNHEQLDTHETVAPHPFLVNNSYSKNIPLFGIGFGNDFGRGNETYINISQAFRPVRYFDIASPFGKFAPNNNPDPTKYLTYEAGVHGWPVLGLYYDVSVFQVNARNRIESQALSPTQSIDVNTGNTRSRGVEGEGSYDLLKLWPAAPDSEHLTLFLNASYLNATFTSSIIANQPGKTPAYSPNYVVKGGLTFSEAPGLKLSLIVDAVGSQFFQDNNQPVGATPTTLATPARIPAYTIADFSGEYKFGGHWRVLGGISNLTDKRYYSRVFISRGMLEPALSRQFYAGIAYDL
ncbi:MAG TPA: TonB-dependent receptor [Steroidobacteraceae bacterium]|nr:TonB-dependent receptor [Steroidobacteraceae bacterium]